MVRLLVNPLMASVILPVVGILWETSLRSVRRIRMLVATGLT